MLSRADLNSGKISLSKNLLTDQTYNNLTFRLNSAGRTFDVTYGVGTATETSTLALIHIGGFNDQSITATMRYRAPTVAGAEDFGVVCRFQSSEDVASTTYYYARCTAGFAKITKVIGGTFTNLSSSAFAVAADVDVTIVLTAVGNALTATFSATGGTPVNVVLSAVDSSIPSGGLMGFRTLSKTGYCSSFVAAQL